MYRKLDSQIAANSQHDDQHDCKDYFSCGPHTLSICSFETGKRGQSISCSPRDSWAPAPRDDAFSGAALDPAPAAEYYPRDASPFEDLLRRRAGRHYVRVWSRPPRLTR